MTALAQETRALTSTSPTPGKAVLLDSSRAVWLSGMGQDAARQAATGLIDAGATALAVFGVAGALAPGMRTGTLFCPSVVIDARGHDMETAAAWRASLSRRLSEAHLPLVTGGSLLSLPSPLLSAADKTAMRAHHQAMAVDMESAGVAAIASERGLPFVILRAIIDEQDDNVPAELQAGIDAWGRPLPMRMLATLWHHPRLLGELPGLAARMGKAMRVLRAAARAAGTGLGQDSPTTH
ncbi:purine and other phosphorylase-like protein, family 1 [Dyella sp. 20L07]|uniref:phosphorylase family protein n=1 Tax=Dyella sp. 20L07 TaxID=3384240 RepID=UPI003D2E14A2